MFKLILFLFIALVASAEVPRITSIESFTPVLEVYPGYVSTNKTIQAADIDIATLITIGKTIWSIVDAGKPVVNYQSDWAGAIPKGLTAMDLENFKTASWKGFGWTFKNTYGMETVRFKWNFGFNCKGRYDGHGYFLTDVTTAIQEIYAAWGFTVNAEAHVGTQPTNYGTKVDPIVGLPIVVTLDVKSVLQSFTEKCSVVVKGDCTGVIVSCG